MPPVAHAEDAHAVRPARRRTASGHPARRRRSAFPWLRLCLGSGAVTALMVLAHGPEPSPADAPDWAVIEPAPISAPPPVWEALAQPAAIYAVTAADVQDLPFAHNARRGRDGAREDTLTFGTAEDGAQPYARIVARRSLQPDLHEPSFFVDLARRAADAGLAVSRSAPASGLLTKFGSAEAADAALTGAADRACLAFRLARPEAALRVGGWLCGAGGEPPSRHRLACLIDGLSLRSAEDAALSALFAEAARQRDPACAPPRVAAAPRPAPPARTARRR
jgi:hypothetical protein